MRNRIIPAPISGIFWLLALILVAFLTWKLHSETTTFQGIAEAAETSISSVSAAEVLAVPVVPGQEVSAGDTLARLGRQDLAMRLHEIGRQLEAATGSADMATAEIYRREAETRAGYETRRTRLQFEIDRLVEERAQALALVARLRGAATTGEAEDTTADPILMRIRSLRKELHVEEEAWKKQAALLQGSQGSHRRTSQAQGAALAQELALLRAEEEKLVLRAPADGVVGSVNFRPGEKASPFAPIVTISPHSPTLVRGYIHENAYNRVGLGDSVTVASSGRRAGETRGVVVGLGARIVELPLRMWKVPTVPVWGREVTIRISGRNPFLLGEMVAVRHLEGIFAWTGR